MNFEELKQEFIKLKKEELDYINDLVIENNKRELKEEELLEAYRMINKFANKLDELFKKIRKSVNRKELSKDGIIFEFNVDKDYLSSVKGTPDHKRFVLQQLLINPETYKVEVAYNRYCYAPVPLGYYLDHSGFSNGIRVYTGIYRDYDGLGISYSEYGSYYYLNDSYPESILVDDMKEYEMDKIIIHLPKYVMTDEVTRIFKETLNNSNNKKIMDCVNETNKRINELSYNRNPDTKEKVLLNKIHELYRKVKGRLDKEEYLYKGDFIEILKEIYRLPNRKTVSKEKIIKNGGKNGVIVIPIVKPNNKYAREERKFILTVQNRINNKLIAEFPSGFIEDGEKPLEAAKRELLEETGYTTDDVFILDEAYISPGIDNAKNYIAVAYNCEKTNEPKEDGTELVAYGLFKENELKYIIDKNIMSGAMNKLAYYNYIMNVDGSGYDIKECYTKQNDLKKKRKVNSLEKWR